MRDDGGSPVCSQWNRDKWLDCGCILKLELVGFADGLIGCGVGEKERVQGGLQSLGTEQLKG